MPVLAVKFALFLCLMIPSITFADYETLLPMAATESGSYSVSGKVGNTIDSNFLIDTGASMSTISRDLFKKIKGEQTVTHVRRIAARLANGKLQKADVYRISNFVIGSLCGIESIEVAVMPHSGRNILGMNALEMTAPFGLNVRAKTLAVSQCTAPPLELDKGLASIHE